MKKSLLLIFSLVSLNSIVFAASATWDGTSSAGSNWSDAMNWVGDVAPGVTGYDITLKGVSRLDSIIDLPWSVNSLTFGGYAGAFNLTGQDLTIGSGGITVGSSNWQIINNNVNLSASQLWNEQWGALKVNGAVNGNGFNLSKVGGVGQGYGGEALWLGGTGANTNISTFTVEGGTVYLDKNHNTDAIPGDLVIKNNGFVRLLSDEQINDGSHVVMSDQSWLDLAGHKEQISSLSGIGTVNVAEGRITVSGTQSTTFAGSIISNDACESIGGLTKDGSSTLLLTGISTYSGQTIVNGGTLAIGGNQRLSYLSDLVMGGGTFDTGGFSQGLGVLTLNADSTINMGNGNSILTFNNSSKIGWNAGKTLTITNWSGNTAGGGIDQFRVGASGLNTAQLKEIKFFNPAGLAAGLYDATLLPSGEVVPVPEPATLALGGLLMGLVAKRSRKKKTA